MLLSCGRRCNHPWEGSRENEPSKNGALGDTSIWGTDSIRDICEKDKGVIRGSEETRRDGSHGNYIEYLS